VAERLVDAGAAQRRQTSVANRGGTQQDIQDAVNAASSVGDDTIERKAGQQVNPDTFTHGTAAQRGQWFSTGYGSGNPKSCNTFTGTLGS
jgi:predicted metalloprotease